MGADEGMRGEIVTRGVPGQVRAADRDRVHVVAGEVGVAGEELTSVVLMEVEANASLVIVIRADHGCVIDRRAYVPCG